MDLLCVKSNFRYFIAITHEVSFYHDLDEETRAQD